MKRLFGDFEDHYSMENCKRLKHDSFDEYGDELAARQYFGELDQFFFEDHLFTGQDPFQTNPQVMDNDANNLFQQDYSKTKELMFDIQQTSQNMILKGYGQFQYPVGVEKHIEKKIESSSESTSEEQFPESQQNIESQQTNSLILTDFKKSQIRSDYKIKAVGPVINDLTRDDSELPIMQLLDAIVKVQNEKDRQAKEKLQTEFQKSKLSAYINMNRPKESKHTHQDHSQANQQSITNQLKVQTSPFQLRVNKRQNKLEKVVYCQHTEEKYYANGLCRNCYHRVGRTKRAHDCSHVERKLYAKGICKKCYQNKYHKINKEMKVHKSKKKTQDQLMMSISSVESQ
eukprot:403343295